jgi:hypothetical protein
MHVTARLQALFFNVSASALGTYVNVVLNKRLGLQIPSAGVCHLSLNLYLTAQKYRSLSGKMNESE